MLSTQKVFRETFDPYSVCCVHSLRKGTEMTVRVLTGAVNFGTQDISCLYDDTREVVFGPVFYSDESAERFLDWLERPANTYAADSLIDLKAKFLSEVWNEAESAFYQELVNFEYWMEENGGYIEAESKRHEAFQDFLADTRP